MAVPIRNLQSIKSKNRELGEALEDIRNHLTNISQSVVVNPNGESAIPPPINSLNVTGQDGIYQASITDNNNLYRGINYFLEYSPKSDFSNSHVVSLGPSRNSRLNLGNQLLHFRAYSQYNSGGPPSIPVIHGSPTPVTAAFSNANLSVSGPSIPISSGSGTNVTPIGGEGAGKALFTQTATGLPPKL